MRVVSIFSSNPLWEINTEHVSKNVLTISVKFEIWNLGNQNLSFVDFSPQNRPIARKDVGKMVLEQKPQGWG